VLVLERGGYAAGPQSLAGALVAAAGWRIADGAPAGLGGFVALERVIALQPDLLVLVDPPSQAADQGALFLNHPALRNLYPPERRIALPSRFTLCGGPALVAALDYLADVLAHRAEAP
jgi:iron complex transport system substrate-binding protein